MPRKPAQLAKLARPTADGLMERPRLFTLLDQICRQRIVWLSAPAGAGKTSLITSYLEFRRLPCLWYQIDAGDDDLATFFYYLGNAAKSLFPRKRPLPSLTPEYLIGLETFIRLYFRSLFERLLPPSVLIFDNFHEAPKESNLFFVFAKAIEEIPPGNTIIFISRFDPPPPLARTYTRAAVIDWEQLKFNDEEAAEFLSSLGYDNPAVAQSINGTAQGWIAGLVLLARSPENGGMNFPREPQQPHILYDYFTQEVFNKIPESSHDILIKTSLFPSVTPITAYELTGTASAGDIIASLHRDRFFIDRHSQNQEMYVYHPLFRAFLLQVIEQRYPEPERMKLKQQAARLLEDTELIETAVDLYFETGSWEDVSRLISAHAFEFLSEGRHSLLKRWIDRLPLSQRNRDPDILYWLGMSRMPFSQPESRVSLESALRLFKSRNDVVGRYLALSAILTSFYYEWGDFTPVSQWLDELEALIKQYPDFPSIQVEAQVAIAMMAILMYRPQHSFIESLKKRVVPLIRACSTPQQKISVASPALLHWLLGGEFAAAEELLIELKDLLDMKRISPSDAIGFKIFESIFAWKQGAYSTAIGKLEEAGAIARHFDLHLFDCLINTQKCLAYAGAEQLQSAAEALSEAKAVVQPGRRVDVLTLKNQEIGLSLKRRTATRGCIAKQFDIVKGMQEIATPYGEAEARLLYSQALVAFGEYESAKPEFVWLKAFAKAMPCRHIEFRTLVVEAYSAFLAEDNETGFSCLKQALAIGAANSYTSCFPIWHPNVLPRLFAEALNADIEADYVRQFIRARNLGAPSPDIEQWPWPVRIHTLGQFSLLLDDQPLYFQGKTQKKPLELLKCLIAYGGKKVSQTVLAGQLWPDLEGDAARNACDLALHRLRKLLVKPEAAVLQDGKLGLDPNYVWVDAWAFERLCGAVDNEQRQDTGLAAAQKLLSLYPGHFLDSEDGAWALSYRERLNSKFHRCVDRLTRQLALAEAWDEAAALYRKAIELDPLTEAFHCGLIRCYQAQGRIAEALAAYRHCRDMLSILLGVKPSPKTQELYRSLKSG